MTATVTSNSINVNAADCGGRRGAMFRLSDLAAGAPSILAGAEADSNPKSSGNAATYEDGPAREEFQAGRTRYVAGRGERVRISYRREFSEGWSNGRPASRWTGWLLR